MLQATVPEIADVNNFKNIFITTKNNADENIPAIVDVTIQPLQTPAKAYRKRLWERPDQFVMSKEAFSTYFPYDEYEDETDYHEWKKLGAVMADTFNTTSTSKYKLPKQLQQGWYCIETSTRDKYGDTIKDVRYVQLYDMHTAGLPAPQTNFSQNISNSGVSGDKAQLLLGTSEPDVFVVEKISNNTKNAIDSFQYIHLNNNKKHIEYTIQSTDHGNIGLYYAFIKHNRFYTGGMQFYIANEVKKLNITYASFRNKTEPGSKETWTVQVNSIDSGKADAELLTGMYDASLDQFKKQQWEVPYFNTNRYVNNEWSSNDFDAGSSDENWLQNQFYVPDEIYDHIAQSAGELWEAYETRRMGRIEITKFTPPKIVKDEELKGYLSGRAMGLSVPANYAPGNMTEVVVTAAGLERKKSLTGSISVVTGQSISDTSYFKTKIRSIAGTSNLTDILVIIDGVVTAKKIDALDANVIDNVVVLKGSEATALYGAKAANGAIIVTTKEYALRNGKKKDEEPQVQVRKNFNETAFFYPQLHADSAGNYTISFTMPEALTTWKWMSLVHNKQASFGLKEQNIITQKILMVQPNLPRFLRQGDSMYITAKVTNLSDSTLSGKATLQLLDGMNEEPLNDAFNINTAGQTFTVNANGSTTIKFPINIPHNYAHPLIIKVIAEAGRYSDGEERMLPVLSNRLLVTETLPLFMPGEGSKTFKFEKLLNNTSPTLTNESLTIEYTPNPVWYVVQSLPYLMQFPHECAEQTFNRFYANALATYIINNNPSIKNVLNKWQEDTTVLQSDLETNAALKQILLNETPWVNDAENEAQQKKNLALLFDSAKTSTAIANVLQQLKQVQKSNGAFAWFSGGYDDRYITQYILTGIGKLKKLNAIPPSQQNILKDITSKALNYADKEAKKEYEALIKNKADLSKNQLTPLMIQYWYMRSFFGDEHIESVSKDVFKFSMQQIEQYWMKQSPYLQGMLAIALNRLWPVMQPVSKFKNTQLDIIKSLKENAVEDAVKGMYWKNNTGGYYWYQNPLETQSLLINAFAEITPADDTAIYSMRKWLILNKQTNNWGNTKATADACYALLSNNNINTQNLAVTINAGDSTISTLNEIQQTGSGYIKHSIKVQAIQPSMGNIEMAVSNPVAKSATNPPSYGAVYWKYFEDMDKISSASTTLSISKKLFMEKNTDKGKLLELIGEKDTVKPGDKVVIRLILKTDREMEYVYLKDLRAAAMEPVNVLSEYKWQDGLGYYMSTKDAATHFFIDHLSKGTYVLEYPVYITHTGNFSAGISSVQCMYAPEFTAHSESINIKVQGGEK